MIPEEYTPALLRYLSTLRNGPELHALEELHRLPAAELLKLAQKVDDSVLGFFVSVLKNSPTGENLFEKLMGGHEEENRELVDAFFTRYMKIVLSPADSGPEVNPLVYYLPPPTFDDLAFVQSRQHFFLRQSMDTINDYLAQCFPGSAPFTAGEQEKAWAFFWQKVLER